MKDWTGDFPILSKRIHGRRLAYLDSAASTQKPYPVIAIMDDCLRHHYSNVHRGVHLLSQQLSARYEQVREIVADFIGATNAQEIVFTKGATDGINLLAASLGRLLLRPGDKVLITAMEHHANIVPWQLACEYFGAELVVLPMDKRGILQLDKLDALLEGVKIFSMAHVSNALGTVNDVATLIAKAKSKGVVTIVDGAQAIAHMAVDVQALDCDFYVFSGHKLYGPTGVGVLYGRMPLLEAMPPYQGGGDMILSVRFEKTIFAPPPHKFETGTPPIVEVIGLGEAIRWTREQDVTVLGAHEEILRSACESALSVLPGITIYGTAAQKAGIISFTLAGVHPHDVGSILDEHGVAVRVGHHCAEPVMRFFSVTATIRASFAAYNTMDDVTQLADALKNVQEIFS